MATYNLDKMSDAQLEELRYLNRINRQTQLASQGAPMADRILDAAIKDYQKKASAGAFDSSEYKSTHDYRAAYEDGAGDQSEQEARKAATESGVRVKDAISPYKYTNTWNSWKAYSTASKKRDSWFSGSTPTYGESLAYVADLSITDPDGARQIYDKISQLKGTPGSPYFNPYGSGSTIEGAKAFFGIDSFSSKWIQENRGLLQYLKTSDVTGNVTQPGKKASWEEQAAYWYYKVAGQHETTQNAKEEWSNMQKEIQWYVDAGYSDAEILNRLSAGVSNYKTLNSIYEESQKGTAAQLTEGIGYSPEAIRGVIWMVRNGQEVGDPSRDYTNEIAKYYRSVDYERANQLDLRDNPASDDYNPYRRATSDLPRELGVQSLSEADMDKFGYLKGTDQKTYEALYKQNQTTKLAETEYAALMKEVERIIANAKSSDAAVNSFYRIMEEGVWDSASGSNIKLTTLLKMDEARYVGSYTELLRPVDYRAEDVEAYIRKKITDRELIEKAWTGDREAEKQILAIEAANADPNDALQKSSVYEPSMVDYFYDTVDPSGSSGLTAAQRQEFYNSVKTQAISVWNQMVGEKPEEAPSETPAVRLIGYDPASYEAEEPKSKSADKKDPDAPPYLDLNALPGPGSPTITTAPSGFGVTVEAAPVSEEQHLEEIVKAYQEGRADDVKTAMRGLTDSELDQLQDAIPDAVEEEKNRRAISSGMQERTWYTQKIEEVADYLEQTGNTEAANDLMRRMRAISPFDTDALQALKEEVAPSYGTLIQRAIEANDLEAAAQFQMQALEEYDALTGEQALVVYETLAQIPAERINADPELSQMQETLDQAMNRAVGITQSTPEQQAEVLTLIDDLLFDGRLKEIQQNEGVGFWTAAGHATVQGLASFESGIAKGLRWVYDAMYAPFSLIPGATEVQDAPIHQLLTKWAEYRDNMNARSNAYMLENGTPLEVFGAKVGSTLVNTAANAYLGVAASSTNLLSQGVSYAGGAAGSVMGNVPVAAGQVQTLGKALALKRANDFFQMAGFTLSSAGQSAYESEQRGENIFTQTLLGMIGGAVTYVTEKFSLGNLLDRFTLGTGGNVTSALTQQGKSFLARWGDAGLALLGNMVVGGAKEGLQEVTESAVTDLATFAVNRKGFMDGDPVGYLKSLGSDAVYGFLSGMVFQVAAFPAESRSALVINQAVQNGGDVDADFVRRFTEAYFADLQDPNIVAKAEDLQTQQIAELDVGEEIGSGALETVIDEANLKEQASLAKQLQPVQEWIADLTARYDQAAQVANQYMQEYLQDTSNTDAQHRYSGFMHVANTLAQQLGEQKGAAEQINARIAELRTEMDTALKTKLAEIRENARVYSEQQRLQARAQEIKDNVSQGTQNALETAVKSAEDALNKAKATAESILSQAPDNPDVKQYWDSTVQVLQANYDHMQAVLGAATQQARDTAARESVQEAKAAAAPQGPDQTAKSSAEGAVPGSKTAFSIIAAASTAEGDGETRTGGVVLSSANKNTSSNPLRTLRNLAQDLGIGASFGTNRMNPSGTRIPSNVLGYFNDNGGYVVTRNAGDFWTSLHEVGHAIRERLDIQSTQEMLDALPAVFRDNYSPESLPGEAFAEFFRQYMTHPDRGVSTFGSNVVSDFESKLGKNNLLKTIQNRRNELQAYQNASVADRMRAMVVDRADPNPDGRAAAQRITSWIREKTTSMLDWTRPAEDVNAAIRKASGENEVAMSRNAREQALLFNQRSARTEALFTNALSSPDGTIVGPSLQKVFADVGLDGKGTTFEDFSQYMLLLHSFDRDVQNKPVFDNEQFSDTLRRDLVQQLEAKYPNFQRAEQAFQEWRNQFVQTWLVDTGFMSQDVWDDLKAKYPHYVPTYRFIPQGTNGSLNSQQGPSGDFRLRQAVGSAREIINPFDSIVSQTSQIVDTVLRNNIALAFDNAYNAYPVLGEFARPINQDQSPAPVTRPVDLDDAVSSAGIPGQSSEIAVNEAMRNAIRVIRPDGTVVFYEFSDPDLYSMLSSGGANAMKHGTELLGRVTRAMTMLTTGSNPVFSVTNAIRDIQKSVGYGSWASNPITAFPRWLQSFYEVWRSSGEYADYKALGGGGWNRIGPETHSSTRQYREDLFRGYNTRDVGSTLHTALDKLWSGITLSRLNEIVEQTSRYAEYRFGRNDKSTAEGRQTAFRAAQEVTVDFSRRGDSALAATLRHVIPFYNATLQGTYQVGRQFTSNEKTRLPIRFVKTVFNTALMSSLSYILLQRFGDEDDKRDYGLLSEEIHSNYFVFPNPFESDRRFIRLSVSQDPLAKAVHGTLSAAFRAGSWDEFGKSMLNLGATIVDGINPFETTIVSPLFQVAANENWYGGSIVPTRLQYAPTTRQYNDGTAEIFLQTSRALDSMGIELAPLQLQYLADQYGGFVGDILIPALSLDRYSGDMGGISAVLKGFANRFTIDPKYSNDVTDTYYQASNSLDAIVWESKQDSTRYGSAYSDLMAPGLTEEEYKQAALEAKELIGLLFDPLNETIAERYERIDEILGNQALSEKEKNTLTTNLRMENVYDMVSALEAYADYEEQYMGKGSAFTYALFGGPKFQAPTAVDAMDAVFKQDLDARYMQISKAEYEATGKASMLPHPNEYFDLTEKSAEGNVAVRYIVPEDRWEEYAAFYRDAYKSIVEGYANAWDEIPQSQREKILSDAHSKAHTAAKNWYLSTYPGVGRTLRD